MTVVPSECNYHSFYTRLIMLKVDGEVKKSVLILIPDDDKKTTYFTGKLLLTSSKGYFKNGFGIVNGIVKTQLILRENKSVETKGNRNIFLLNDQTDNIVMDTITLDNVIVTAKRSSEPNFLSIGDYFSSGGGGVSWEDIVSGSSGEDGSYCYNNGGNTPPKPEVDEVKKKPCPGDPIKNPEIAPQTNSGVRGGMFGYTRSGGKQFHNGIDIKNDYGDPIYSMYDGTARLVTQTRKGKVVGAGHYVEVTSIVDNKKVQILYFHMQKANRVSGSVKAGSIIGYQGYSGNLKAAITQGLSQSHLHIKLKVNGKTVNPMPYMATQFDNKTGKAINNPCK